MPASDNLGPQWSMDNDRSHPATGSVWNRDLGPSPSRMGKALGATVTGTVTYAGDIPRVDENGTAHYDVEQPTERWVSHLEEHWTDPKTGKPDADLVEGSAGVYRTMKRAGIAAEVRMKRLERSAEIRDMTL